jgi:hypothetical protein
MRIVQFRKHLGLFVVRVTDPEDIKVLGNHPQFSLLLCVEEMSKLGDVKVLSAEYSGEETKGLSFSEWKQKVWSIIKFRNRALSKKK